MNNCQISSVEELNPAFAVFQQEKKCPLCSGLIVITVYMYQEKKRKKLFGAPVCISCMTTFPFSHKGKFLITAPINNSEINLVKRVQNSFRKQENAEDNDNVTELDKISYMDYMTTLEEFFSEQFNAFYQNIIDKIVNYSNPNFCLYCGETTQNLLHNISYYHCQNCQFEFPKNPIELSLKLNEAKEDKNEQEFNQIQNNINSDFQPFQEEEIQNYHIAILNIRARLGFLIHEFAKHIVVV